MRLTFDANVLVYAINASDGRKHRVAADLMRRAAASDCILTLQSLAETYFVLTRKGHAKPSDAAGYVSDLRANFPVVAAKESALDPAIAAARRERIAFWDAMLWATAAEAGCRMIVSEDFQPDRQLGQIVFRNPFGAKLPPDLDAALARA